MPPQPPDVLSTSVQGTAAELFKAWAATVQATTETLMTPCDGVVSAPPAALPAAHSH